jgi:hypothetical protein
MLIQLGTSLGLLTVATILVDLLMLKLMPLRRYYTQIKFEETLDIGDSRKSLAKEYKTRRQTVVTNGNGTTGQRADGDGEVDAAPGDQEMVPVQEGDTSNMQNPHISV